VIVQEEAVCFRNRQGAVGWGLPEDAADDRVSLEMGVVEMPEASGPFFVRIEEVQEFGVHPAPLLARHVA
jgi:hypothetical protein